MKPSDHQVFSAKIIMDVFCRQKFLTELLTYLVISYDIGYYFDHADFAGIHYTGSTHVLKEIWKKIGNNIHKYKPILELGETGGKDFIVAHPSANAKQVVTGITRGAFEFQGQMFCSFELIFQKFMAK
jgi:1-pyrroline-5-carboxylate dehydrogenase